MRLVGGLDGTSQWNPFAAYFSGIHDSVFFFRWVGAVEWAWMAGTAAVLLLLGSAVFERLRDSVAEDA